MWLNSLDAKNSSILFGGIDTKKYVGDLRQIDILPDESGAFTDFSIALTSLDASSPNGTDALALPGQPVRAILDSGTTLTTLPQHLASQTWQEVGAQHIEELGGPVLPCATQGTRVSALPGQEGRGSM